MVKINKKTKWGIFAVALLFIIAAVVAFNIYLDFSQIFEIGENFVDSYLKNLYTTIAVFLSVFILMFVMLFINNKIIEKNLKKKEIFSKYFTNKMFSNIIILVISLVFSYFVYKNLTKNLLVAFNSTWFGRVEEVFNFDLSFFMFVKPFVDDVIFVALSFLAVLLIYSFFIYFFLYVDITNRNVIDMLKNAKISNHLFVLALILILFVSAKIWLSSFNIVYGDFAGLDGAGFVDINFNIFLYRFFSYVLFFGAVILYLIKKSRKKISIIWISALILITFLGGVTGFLVQSFYVSPNEVMVEYPFIKRNIKFTRFGYNIDDVLETKYSIKNTVSKNDFADNSIIDNARIIDFDSTLIATNQLQTIRNYYKFNDIDVALYDVKGKKELVTLGVRELNKANLEESSRNYTNEKLKFTHGYGVVMSATNKVNSLGEPYYYIKDLSVTNEIESVEIKNPRIYYGENNNEYSIANSKTPEFDYSLENSNYEFSYDGDGGIKLNFINRLVYSIANLDYKMLVTNQIHSNSRLIINTNILERAKMVAPFLKFDADPKAVIDNGKIYWIIDAYTHSDLLPYSAKTDGFNYIRNSVKVLVDAYTGDTKFYIIDKYDPVVNTYKKIYPSLFESAELPKSIAQKSSYPEWLFSVQCKVYATYHATTPSNFYNKNDVYAIANEKYNNNIRQMVPYYNYIKLDEFNKYSEEMVLMLPYTLYNKDNMEAWIAVGNQGNNYGKIVCYKFPKNLNIYGPLQVENLIDNDPEISKELTLWNSGGGNVIRGNLMIIPVANTVLYIEPIYLNSDNQAALPVLQRIIVSLGDKIVMETNIEKALDKILNTDIVLSQTKPSEETVEPIEDIFDDITIKNVIDSYYELEKSATDNNWTEFGTAMDKMKDSVATLEKMYEENNK